MKIKTLQFRIKNPPSSLNKMARSVNYVWNYCNEVNQERWAKFRKTYSNFDLQRKTKGCSKDLGIAAQTIYLICNQFDQSRRARKKIKLKWRIAKRSLGWIPFTNQVLVIKNDSVIYRKQKIRFWKSREIEGIFKQGSFSQDSKGHWYVNLTIEEADGMRMPTGKEAGVDLGLKTIATLSDGVELTRPNLTAKYAPKLAMAQMARKPRLVKAIHAKIRNVRQDFNHKASAQLVRKYDTIIVGNVSPSKLKKTRMAKSVSDAGWADFKRMLAYKAIGLGVHYKEVNESFSTVTCSSCLQRTGPSGLSALGVREWVCPCGVSHNRDVNAARNILRIGHDTLIKGVQTI